MQQKVNVVFHVDEGESTYSERDRAMRDRLAPKRIPQILHQTYWTPNLADSVKHWPTSWRKLNLQWEARFYNDQDCMDFVEKYFPQYMAAYTSLPKPVERADFFRWALRLAVCESRSML